MSGDRHIKQAIIAVLCEHPDQDKYKARAFSGESLERVMESFSGRGLRISKEDIFLPDDDGRLIVDTPGFWRNFSKVAALIEKNGDFFTFDDFDRSLPGGGARRLSDSAADHKGFKDVFSASVWRGRFDEMERAWYAFVPLMARREIFGNNGRLGLDLKREMLATEGKELPEDRLARAGLKPEDIADAFAARGNYEEIKRKLATAGDYLRKEYLLLPNEYGDTAFYYDSAWTRYQDIVAGMAAHGDRFELADFFRQVGTVQTVLSRAADKSQLHQVLTPAHWAGRLHEMHALCAEFKDAWKSSTTAPAEIDRLFAEAENLTYAPLLALDGISTRAEALTPVRYDENTAPVYPAGLRSFWENFDRIDAAMAARGEALTIDDLRKTSGETGYSCMMIAIKLGYFDKIALIARRSHQPLALEDFLQKDNHKTEVIRMLADRGQLAQVFAPAMWVGRLAEMRDLWKKLTVAERRQVNAQGDIGPLEVAVRQATLRMRRGGPRPPGGGDLAA